ncbi:NAD(P)H-dependent oxidoreductase [Mycobacterium sp. Y57]|uniref:NAD(P)H-dependent oxidoreductase n=1 Tax=Mycolicibacterium xanthum TaxID=2796469 RepID=UPI001C86249E|nr:NAD(P)H-dependent oxidoreductase [Mycolicibacterium xanthum]MBX7433916.1 NAD(P)H-dependent oxidoreductase [Mycolicibacterium xanthum]
MSATSPGVTVLVVVGSLRKASVNRQLAQVAIENAPSGVQMVLFDRVGELPLYNEDLDTEPPLAQVAALREAAGGADAALAVTPEYNGSIPGALKNVIDWLSRPYGRSPMKGKPVAVIGASLGQYGGGWAHDEARKSFGIAGLQVVDDCTLSMPTKSLAGRHPAEHDEVVQQLRGITQRLAAAVVR